VTRPYAPSNGGRWRLVLRFAGPVALTWICVIGVAAGSDGAAQDEAAAQDTLDLADLSLEELLQVPVFVTASRHEEGITRIPHAVSVITAEDIRRAGARSIPDALRLAPGVDVADLSSAQSAVSPRGFHGFLANQALVLVDGRQVYDSLFGGTVWGSWPFQVEDIERIEVIRGPGGVTWGPNAVNGVINIITKDPLDQQGLTLALRGGTRGAHGTYAGYGLTDGALRLRVSGEYDAHDGFIRGGSPLHGLDDDYRVGRLSLHAVHEARGGDRTTLSAGSAVMDGGFPSTPLAGWDVYDNPHSEASFLLGRWNHKIDDRSNLELTGFVNDFHVSPGITAVDYRYQQIGMQLAHEVRLSDQRRRRGGIDLRLDLLDAGNSDPRLLSRAFVSTGIVGLYLSEEWRFAPRWSLTLGGRLDYESYAGFMPSARASLAYELHDDGLLYAAVSRAAEVPSAAGRFLRLPLINGLVEASAGRGVDPTTVLAYELGYRGRLSKTFDTSVNLFWHEYDEVTAFALEWRPPGRVHYHFDNRSGAASLYGVEWEGVWRVAPRLTLTGHYTYQQLNWDVDEPFTARDYISPPRHKFMLAATCQATERLRLSSHLYYVDAAKAPDPDNPFAGRHIDPYLRLDLMLEHELVKDRASLTLGVRNLLDSGHFEGASLFLSDAETPRMAFAEVRIRVPR